MSPRAALLFQRAAPVVALMLFSVGCGIEQNESAQTKDSGVTVPLPAMVPPSAMPGSDSSREPDAGEPAPVVPQSDAGAPSNNEEDAGLPAVTPPKPSRTIRFMAVGNTSSAGSTNTASYRYWLQKKFDAVSIPYDFVGSQNKTTSDGVQGPYKYKDFDPDHESYASLRVISDTPSRDTRKQMKGWVERSKPDVVLMILAMGDIMYVDKPDYQSIAGGYVEIIKQARAANPNIAIFMSSPHPIKARSKPNSMENLAALIPHQKRVVEMMNSSTSPVVFVDIWTDYDPDTDNLGTAWHPDESGEKIIADRFLETFKHLMEIHSFF